MKNHCILSRELSSAEIFEFAFVAASLELRGASGAPFRPIALPVR